MSSPWILVSPANRGIGYALTRHLLQTTRLPILATARPHHDPSAVKASLLDNIPADDQDGAASRLSIVHLDVTDEDSVAQAAARAAQLFPADAHHLRLAAAIPGVLRPEKHLRQVDPAASLESFRVNAVGPLLLMKHFSPFLPGRAADLSVGSSSGSGAGAGAGVRAGAASEQREPQYQDEEDSGGKELLLPPHAVWLTMAARVGSTADNRSGGWFSYRASKAAVFSLARSFDLFLRGRCGDRALSAAYHPGTVRTDFSRDFWAGVPPGKLFGPEFAAARMADVMCGLTPEQRGRCWDWKGEEVPP